jgi:hypothetical protein
VVPAVRGHALWVASSGALRVAVFLVVYLGSHARAAPGQSHLPPKSSSPGLLAAATAGADDGGSTLSGKDGEGKDGALLFLPFAQRGVLDGVCMRA